LNYSERKVLAIKLRSIFRARTALTITFLTLSLCAFSQQDSAKKMTLKEVVVTSYKEEPIKETTLNISVIDADSIGKLGIFNLTEMIAKTPGVTMLSTGIGISKPVIRGLYGNRVLVLLSGLKFDNQQWQEEHGLGLSDFGLSKVELIKGPMSVLYGTEAIGGIINLVEEEKPEVGKSERDYSIRFNSNTLGGLAQYGYKENKGDHWYRIRAGVENHGDYSDGNNSRVLNSRFDGYYLKGTYGFLKNRWSSSINYMSSMNRFGFIFNDAYSFIEKDARWSRSLAVNPYHLVLLNIVSAENIFVKNEKTKFHLNVGVQSNERMENEGGGAISLNMHLLTLQYLMKWEHQLNEHNKIIVSDLGSFENNTNYGARKIVPDANMQENTASVYYESEHEKIVFENGIGGGEKFIQSKLTPTVNTIEKDIAPFSRTSFFYNGFTGVSLNPNKKLNLKFNAATGVRLPNLAELSANGLHEGIFTYEIGDPTLKNEQNVSLNLQASYSAKRFEIWATPFYTRFFNYIYLTPVDEEWFGFPVYRYKQQDAIQYGTEAGLSIYVDSNITIKGSYSGMIGKTLSDEYLPFTPPQKISPSVNIQFGRNRQGSFYVGSDHVFWQTKIAAHETATPAYNLLNAGVSYVLKKKHETTITIAGNNLLNHAYYEHLSRFKSFGLYNVGRNVMVSVKVKI
jgi:iron complex outermembrane recepter protein